MGCLIHAQELRVQFKFRFQFNSKLIPKYMYEYILKYISSTSRWWWCLQISVLNIDAMTLDESQGLGSFDGTGAFEQLPFGLIAKLEWKLWNSFHKTGKVKGTAFTQQYIKHLCNSTNTRSMGAQFKGSVKIHILQQGLTQCSLMRLTLLSFALLLLATYSRASGEGFFNAMRMKLNMVGKSGA